MRVIHKTISLEQFKSRMLSIIPAYDTNGNIDTFITNDDLSTSSLLNYNMYPLDIKLEKKIGEYDDKIYTYSQLSTIFHTLDEEYNKWDNLNCTNVSLSDDDKMMYQWLITKCFPYFVFDIELNKQTDISLNINTIKKYWGLSKLSIQEVKKWINKFNEIEKKCSINPQKYSGNTNCECNDYEKRGGSVIKELLETWLKNLIKPTICDINDFNRAFTYTIQETDKFVTVKVIKEEKKGKIITNHCFEIFEPVVRIVGNNRYIKYGEITYDNKIKNPEKIEIIDGILTIHPLGIDNDTVIITSKPYFSIPLTLNNSMVNMGELSSIVEPWERGKEYNQNLVNDIAYDGGALAFYNNDTWVLESYDNPGYIYSNKYREVYFGSVTGMEESELNNFLESSIDTNDYNEAQWKRFFDSLPSLQDMIINDYSYKNNKLIINPNPFEMGDEYEIYTNENNGYCVYKEMPHPLFQCQFIEINNSLYEIFYVFQNYNPYIEINQKRILLNYVDEKNKDKVIIKKITNCIGTNQIFDIQSDWCFYYKKQLFRKNNDDYIDGYATLFGNYNVFFTKEENTNIFKIHNLSNSLIGKYVDVDTMMGQNNTFMGYTTYLKNNKNYVRISDLYETYNGNYIKGTTTSRLWELKDTAHIAVDDRGYELDGLMPYKTFEYEINGEIKTYQDYDSTPKMNDWLTLPYYPQYIANIDLVEERDDYKVFCGNIITTVTFSFIEIKSDKREWETITVTSLREMRKIEREIQIKITSKLIYDVSVSITYYMGTLIKEIINNEQKSYELFLNESKEFYGIQYIDEFKIEHKQCLFYYDDMNSSILNYLNLIPTISSYTNQTYNVSNLEEPITQFQYHIKPFDLQYGYLDYLNSEPIFCKVNEFADKVQIKHEENVIEYPIEFNGIQKYFSIPLFREEQMFNDYNYYIIKDGVKYDVINEGTYFSVTFDENERYITHGLYNNFTHISYESVPLVDKVYCVKNIKLYLITSEGNADKYFDYKNNMSLSPTIFHENKLGFAMPEKINGDIYIDRGTIRALDFHLRLLEAKSLESLEQIGNGFFKINSNNDF